MSLDTDIIINRLTKPLNNIADSLNNVAEAIKSSRLNKEVQQTNNLVQMDLNPSFMNLSQAQVNLKPLEMIQAFNKAIDLHAIEGHAIEGYTNKTVWYDFEKLVRTANGILEESETGESYLNSTWESILSKAGYTFIKVTHVHVYKFLLDILGDIDEPYLEAVLLDEILRVNHTLYIPYSDKFTMNDFFYDCIADWPTRNSN